MNNQPAIIARSAHVANLWLSDVGQHLGHDRQHSYHALKAVLHAVRDRLSVDESAQLAAQLPMLIRGLYFHSWDPQPPARPRSRKQFLEDIRKALEGISPLDPEVACHAVFHALDHYISPEELDQVKKALPKSIRDLWVKSDHPESKIAAGKKDKKGKGVTANYDQHNWHNDDYNQPSRNQGYNQGRFIPSGRHYDDMADLDYESDDIYSAGASDWEDENYYGRSNDNRLYRYGEGSRGNQAYGNRSLTGRSSMRIGNRDQGYGSGYGGKNYGHRPSRY